VVQGYAPVGEFSVNGGAKAEPSHEVKQLLSAATLASDARLVQSLEDGVENDWDIKGDPTEGALVVAAAKAGIKKEALDESYPRMQEIPFTSESKRMTTLHQMEKGIVAYTKGAPEIILDNCDSILTESGVKKLDDATRKQVIETGQ
jgi:Ca2+-transporting ATPase